MFREATRQDRAAITAPAAFIQAVFQYVEPVAHHERCTTAMTVRCATDRVVHVSGIDIPLAGVHGDATCPAEGGRGRSRDVAHFVVGMKCTEVMRNTRPEFAHDPFAHRSDLLIAVVLAGNE